jgi:anti-sigma regulatory factor (Ser/Thr protein kinase)
LCAAVGELERLRAWLERVCESYQLPEQISFQLDLCLTELVTNVISYAYPTGAQVPEDAVAVRLVRKAGEVSVEITDRGVEFDPVTYVPDAPARSLDDARIGGRGLLLVHKFAAQLRYRREQDRNRLTLSFPTPAHTV